MIGCAPSTRRAAAAAPWRPAWRALHTAVHDAAALHSCRASRPVVGAASHLERRGVRPSTRLSPPATLLHAGVVRHGVSPRPSPPTLLRPSPRWRHAAIPLCAGDTRRYSARRRWLVAMLRAWRALGVVTRARAFARVAALFAGACTLGCLPSGRRARHCGRGALPACRVGCLPPRRSGAVRPPPAAVHTAAPPRAMGGLPSGRSLLQRVPVLC